MNEVKYEPIFGDQSLFDGAPDDAEYAGWFCQETRWYMILNGKILFSDGGTWCTSDNPYLSADIAAMRRIIKEPERWTLKDQKAGRLPEVGAKLIHKTRGICEFIGVGISEDACWALKQQSGSIYIADKNWCQPIETPEEKAARLREEWKNNVIAIHHGKRRKMSTSTFLLDDIYDALLSGELAAPKGDK